MAGKYSIRMKLALSLKNLNYEHKRIIKVLEERSADRFLIMEKKEYEKLYQFENYYWWHIGRSRIIYKLLKNYLPPASSLDILDVGCGTGINLGILAKFGRVVGLDSSKEALQFARKRGFTNLRQGRAEKLPFANKFFDLVTALDVIEHIADDLRALQEFHRVLTDDGLLLITAPAYQFIWSEHDEALHHFRRYTASQIHQKLNQAGFRVIKRSYIITFNFPLILGYRLLRGLFPKNASAPQTSYVVLPRFFNNFLIFSLKIEAQLLKYLNLPFGTSVVCLCQKD